MQWVENYKRVLNEPDAKTHEKWASGLRHGILEMVSSAPDDVPKVLEFTEEETVLWALLKLPRSVKAHQDTTDLQKNRLVAILHGLSEAGLLIAPNDTRERHILPLEIKRIRNRLKGIEDAPSKPLKRVQMAPPPSFRKGKRGPKKKAKATHIEVAQTSEDIDHLQGPARALAQKIMHYGKRLETDDLYDFMGIPRSATDREIKGVFFQLVKELHPDNLSRQGVKDEFLHERSRAVFSRLNEAYDTLKDIDRRHSYDQEIKSGKGQKGATRQGKVRREREARMQTIKAETFFKRGDYRNAEAHYKLAIQFDEEDPAIATAHAWCVTMNPVRKPEDRMTLAKDLLAGIINRHNYGDASYKLGLLARRENDEELAQILFEKALSLDPEHPDAVREKRLREMRGDKSPSGKEKVLGDGDGAASGFLGRLFKRDT